MGRSATLAELTDRLRDRVLGSLHVEPLEGGDRLPSIREVARELGEDQRKVARAYRKLEEEGLVEVRGRSGVYMVRQARLGGGILEETAEWLGGVLLEGWKRRIPATSLPEVLRRVSRGMPVRCAFVDSCLDAIEAFSHELEEDFGIRVSRVLLHELHRGGGMTTAAARTASAAGAGAVGAPEGVAGTPARLSRAVLDADFIATTVFSATAVRALLARLGKPIIVVSLHPDVAAAVTRRARREGLTVVCADASFGDRIRMQYEEHLRTEERLQVVLADDHEAVAALDARDPVLLTRAARERIGGAELTLLVPHSPTLSSASAEQIIRFIVRHNSRAE